MAPLETRIQKRLHVSLYALLFLTVLLGLSVVLEGCTDTCETSARYVYYEPVYTPLEVVRAAVAVQGSRPVRSVGRIYFRDNYLFINEPGEGIHVIDDSDPGNPLPKKFISIPGNYDLAINGNMLYADSFMDLLSLDISDLNAIRVIDRSENMFNYYNSLGFYPDATRGVVTSWVEKVDFETADCDVIFQPWGGFMMSDGIALRVEASASFNSKAAIAPGTGSGPGLGGSLARMTVHSDHLYLLNGADVKVVDISNPTHPDERDSLYVSWDIETLFPYKDKLFIGARSGMHILDIATPEKPSFLATYQHIYSCDPVVVSDDYAYVTLRSGNLTCEGFDNQLEILDVSNPASPQLVKTYSMTNPHGLGIDGNLLFVCDGPAGLKMFDVSDKLDLEDNLLAQHRSIHALDAIPYQDVLMLIGEEGIFQYDYADNKNLKLLSHIVVQDED
jgi:hypothetical protein